MRIIFFQFCFCCSFQTALFAGQGSALLFVSTATAAPDTAYRPGLRDQKDGADAEAGAKTAAGQAVFECPVKISTTSPAAETALDCPWAGAARLLSAKAALKEPLGPVFSAYTPGIIKQLAADRADPELLRLWGESVNFDEMANGVIVDPDILAFLASGLGAARPAGLRAHAGMEHTYGYLFSLLRTKFGFKRARWVNDDIESGLGLPRGLIGPDPAEGTLLSNVTCLAGGIALKDDAAASALLAKAACPGILKKYATARIPRSRLRETVKLSGNRKVSLRTDLVPFGKVSAAGNSHLLIYSVYDSAQKKASLITAFPVAEAFVRTVLDPGGLGRGKPVQTRYNAWVDGLGGGKIVQGSREVIRMDE